MRDKIVGGRRARSGGRTVDGAEKRGRKRRKGRRVKKQRCRRHVLPDRREIYFADSARGTIVLPKERIGRSRFSEMEARGNGKGWRGTESKPPHENSTTIPGPIETHNVYTQPCEPKELRPRSSDVDHLARPVFPFDPKRRVSLVVTAALLA